ncbi:MAG: class I SAM-dependent methyltransferase [Planctomycetota bacterium]|nr:class I SAM-dependent methyltransferase [Planctomycetota bacterium]
MLPAVIRAYEQEGFRVRIGSPRLYTSTVHPLGAARHPTARTGLALGDLGFTITDFHLFSLIGAELRPEAGLIIGNAYGVSAITIAEALRPISIDAIDAEVDGPESAAAADLTRRVARRLDLDLRLIRGFSPRDLPGACRFEKYQLAFVDGLHMSHQIIADYEAIAPRMNDRAAIVFHDVGLCRMDEGWKVIRERAARLGFAAHECTFTDYGLTVLLRNMPRLDEMLAITCGGLRDRNETYEIGHAFFNPETYVERPVAVLPEGARIAFYGAGKDLELFRDFIEENPDTVVAILDDDEKKWGGALYGIPIVDPVELPALCATAVVIASRSAERAMRTRIHRLAPHVPVLPAPEGRIAELELHAQPQPPMRRESQQHNQVRRESTAPLAGRTA